MDESIKIADAIIVLRLQKERMIENLLSSIDSYSSDYGLTPEKLSLNNKEIPILRFLMLEMDYIVTLAKDCLTSIH